MTKTMAGSRALAVSLAIALTSAAAPALGQHPHGLPPGQAKRLQPRGSVDVQPAGRENGPSGLEGRVRTFGVWLDDASALEPGEAWVGLSLSRWTMPIATGLDVPVLDGSAGIARRLQIGVTVPFYRVFDPAAPDPSGIGDVYLTAKVPLLSPGQRPFGVAVSPSLEILSSSFVNAVPGTRRLQWVLPVSVEWRAAQVRVYGTSGYFSRGALFAGGAVERWVNDRIAVTGALTHSYVTDTAALADEVGLRRARTDVSGSVSLPLRTGVIVYGGIARTLSRLDPDSTRLAASVGVSLQLARPSTP